MKLVEGLPKLQRLLFVLEKKEVKPKDCKPMELKESKFAYESKFALGSERKRRSGELTEIK